MNYIMGTFTIFIKEYTLRKHTLLKVCQMEYLRHSVGKGARQPTATGAAVLAWI